MTSVKYMEKRELCCGCECYRQVCAKDAISMIPDREGFLYPKINDTLCNSCGLCKKLCPINNKENIACPTHNIAAYAGYIEDTMKQRESSSVCKTKAIQ